MSEGQMWDAPNQQVVRDDASPPWQEGSGGGTDVPVAATAEASLTKAQLLEQAHELGLDVDDTNTKAEIKAALDEAG